jgi:hypothetical protein
MRKELPEPQGGFITRWGRIDNGVYFVDTTDGLTTAVHETVAANLSDMARELGTSNGGYLYYGYIAEAVPLYELSRIRRDVARHIRHDKSFLMEKIRDYFPDYWAAQSLDEDEPEYGDDD